MAEDARFEDADGGPLRLRALDAEDLQVISTLTQDAIFPITEMTWDRRRRRFGCLLNRFRWEEGSAHGPERVQSVLAVEDVQSVRSQGIDRADTDMILSLLSLDWQPGEDGTGRLSLVLAGDGAVELEVEALEVTLRDVTRPYVAPSGHRPDHPE
ncbi:DUF2948 family protein [Rhodobacterales bacterium HKCCE2091]|nr:DUF2948 family protein [Rhodobacterales bacterium HKCCE2091]